MSDSEHETIASVRVPCSTSNLGPGFDFLGLCLGLWVEVRASRNDGSGEHVARYDSETEWAPEDDLVVRAVRAYERHRGASLPSLRLDVKSEVPVGRGFGSSGAAIAAGLLVAAKVNGDAEALVERESILVPVGLELDGHPDNATASLLGGCTLSVPHEEGVSVVRQPVHGSLGFAVAWPRDPLFTDEARRVLPSDVPFADAVENPRRLALLCAGLARGDAKLLRLGLADRLHERFRRELVHGSNEACEAAVAAGAFGACLSGAGSGLVAIGPRPAMEGVAEALAGPLAGGEARVVDFVADAPVPE